MQKLYTSKIIDGDRYLTHDTGLIITYSKDMPDPIPMFCPVCDYIMSGRSDSQYYDRFKCCAECGMKWAEIDQKLWIDGWRPQAEEIKEEVKKRKSIHISFSI
jgi:hypothetical protein